MLWTDSMAIIQPNDQYPKLIVEFCLVQLHFDWAPRSSGSVITSTVPDCFPCLPSAERTTLLIKSSLLWEPLAALFFWDSEKTHTQKKLNFFVFCHFCFSSISFIVLGAATPADLSTAARFCWPSPPTEGWRPSSWRGPCLPCGSPRSPSCSFLPACAAAPSWPSTSRTPLRTPALRHLNKQINYTSGLKGEKVEDEILLQFTETVSASANT